MIYKNIEILVDKYDAFFIDVYGVIFDGYDLYAGVLDILANIKRKNKKVIILSNTTVLSENCKAFYGKLGLIQGTHYDEFVTSGEAFRNDLAQLEAKSVHQIFLRNKNLFSGTGISEVDTIEKADFIYVGALGDKSHPFLADDLKTKSGAGIPIEDLLNFNAEDIAGFEKIDEILKECLKYKKTLFVVNPDIFALEEISGKRRALLCQGAIGKLYENLGGEVKYFGKPYQNIYNFAKSLVGGQDKTAMIGDTPWTDILGGNMAGIDTILVLTGVTGRFLSEFSEKSTEQKFERLLREISPKMKTQHFAEQDQIPTYMAERFA